MNTHHHHRLDFADTRAGSVPVFSRFDVDPGEQLAQADAADMSLLRLVACAAGATLLLALASSIGL